MLERHQFFQIHGEHAEEDGVAEAPQEARQIECLDSARHKKATGVGSELQVMLFLSLMLIKKDLNFKREKEIHFALGSLAYFPCVPYRRVLELLFT